MSKSHFFNQGEVPPALFVKKDSFIQHQYDINRQKPRGIPQVRR